MCFVIHNFKSLFWDPKKFLTWPTFLLFYLNKIKKYFFYSGLTSYVIYGSYDT